MKLIAKTPNTLVNGLLLGWKQDGSPIWDTSREGHLITVAPSGSGKGVSCAVPALLSWRGPVIVVDPRGENYALTADRRRAMGHIVHRLDPFEVCGKGIGDSLNPLDLIDPHSDAFEDNAAVIAHLCMQGGSLGHSDPFWDERACTLVGKIITALFNALPTRRPTLGNVQDILQGGNVFIDPLAELFAPANDDKLPKKKITLQSLVNTGEFAAERTFASILSTANSHLGFLRSPAVRSALTDSTVMLDDVTGGSMQSIYLIIPPDKLISHGKLIRLWVGVMLAAISRRRRAPIQPTLFLVDETAQLGEMNELRAAVTLMRAYGIRVWLFFQDLSQLQSTYNKDWQSIINNCRVQQFFGAKSPHARKLLKDYLDNAAPTEPLKDGEQFLFDGDTLSASRRADYLRDPLLMGLASPHPFHLPEAKELLLH